VSQFFKTLRQALPEIRDRRGSSAGAVRPREVVFPSLTTARETFERYFKQPGMIVWSEREEPASDADQVPKLKIA
jgi:hypothetical protein